VKIRQPHLSHSPLPHAIIGFDGVIRSVNDAWAEFFVTRAHNCVSEPVYRLIDPVDRTDLLSTWEDLSPDNATMAKELRPVRGPQRGEPLTWLFRTQLGADELVVTIVTGPKERKDELSRPPEVRARFDAHLLAALDDLGNGLAVFSGNEIVWVNRAMAEMFGHTEAEIVGTDGFQLVAEHDRVRARNRRRERRAGADVGNHYELDGRKRDGTVFNLEMSISVGSEHGDAVLVCRDITEQKSRTDRKRRAERLRSLGELAASLGREYHNMVMAYSLLTDALREKIGEAAPTELDRLDDVNRRAVKLTRRLVTLEGRPLSQPAATDVNIVAWEAIERCEHLGVEITPRLKPGLPHITVDRDQLEMVLVELIENAVAASRQGGLVLVETADRMVSQHDELDAILSEGRYLTLRVVDDGDGIADEVLEHVVEPFFTTRPLQSLGLGLSTAYSIVRGLGGHIAIHSRDRVGTRVEVFLPVELGADDRPLSRPRVRRMLPEKTQVMLVESSPVLRDLLSSQLSRLGHDVVTLASPNEAFASLQSGNPCDVVVAELVSVGGDGFDFVRRLRGERLDVCVVLTSGRADLPNLTSGAQIPNLGFLHKPFTAERLNAEIRKVLETRQEFV
jgi:PAS domain S-box-containing protein